MADVDTGVNDAASTGQSTRVAGAVMASKKVGVADSTVSAFVPTSPGTSGAPATGVRGAANHFSNSDTTAVPAYGAESVGTSATGSLASGTASTNGGVGASDEIMAGSAQSLAICALGVTESRVLSLRRDATPSSWPSDGRALNETSGGEIVGDAVGVTASRSGKNSSTSDSFMTVALDSRLSGVTADSDKENQSSIDGSATASSSPNSSACRTDLVWDAKGSSIESSGASSGAGAKKSTSPRESDVSGATEASVLDSAAKGESSAASNCDSGASTMSLAAENDAEIWSAAGKS